MTWMIKSEAAVPKAIAKIPIMVLARGENGGLLDGESVAFCVKLGCLEGKTEFLFLDRISFGNSEQDRV